MQTRHVERCVGLWPFATSLMVLQVYRDGEWCDATRLEHRVLQDRNAAALKRRNGNGLFPTGAPVITGNALRGTVVFQEPSEGQVWVRFANGGVKSFSGEELAITGRYISAPTKTAIRISGDCYFYWWCAVGWDFRHENLVSWARDNASGDHQVTCRQNIHDAEINLVGFALEEDANLFYLRFR